MLGCLWSKTCVWVPSGGGFCGRGVEHSVYPPLASAQVTYTGNTPCMSVSLTSGVWFLNLKPICRKPSLPLSPPFITGLRNMVGKMFMLLKGSTWCFEWDFGVADIVQAKLLLVSRLLKGKFKQFGIDYIDFSLNITYIQIVWIIKKGILQLNTRIPNICIHFSGASLALLSCYQHFRD